MYGLVGKMIAVKGKRDELIEILIHGLSGLPGCLNHIVAKDANDPDAIWITEVWRDKKSHDDSLMLPAVQAAIAKGKPLIAAFDNRFETEPIGGHGLDDDA